MAQVIYFNQYYLTQGERKGVHPILDIYPINRRLTGSYNLLVIENTADHFGFIIAESYQTAPWMTKPEVENAL